MNGLTRLAIGFLAALGLGGCAFGNRHVTLTYPPDLAAAAGARAAASQTQPLQKQKVFLVVLLDQRPAKQAVGSVHNGFGMHTADAVAANDVAEWVTDALKTELEKSGFEVVQVPAAAPDAVEPVITGEVIKVYCEAWTKYEAEVAFDARVVKGSREILRKSYVGKNDSTMNWSASSKSYGQALAVALSNAASNFAAEMRRDFGTGGDSMLSSLGPTQ